MKSKTLLHQWSFVTCVVVATLFNSALLKAQSVYPIFNSQKIQLTFSKAIPGIMDDVEHTVNDSLKYELIGQIFTDGEGKIQKLSEGFTGSTNRSTPWETLSELIAAYETRDVSRILELYDANSQGQVESVFLGSNAELIWNQLSDIGNIEVLAGFEYKNGYFAISESEKLGIVSNFFVKENGQYKLSSLDDSNSQSWNIALYFKFKPEPVLVPQLFAQPDSVSLGEDLELEIKLNKSGNWIILMNESVGEPTIRFIRDNEYGDLNSNPGIIKLAVPTKPYFNKGVTIIRLVESNYPIRSVAADIVALSGKLSIKIY